jgi:NAD(P)H-hydrate epimerase
MGASPSWLKDMVCTPWPERDANHLLVTGSQLEDLEKTLFASGLPVEALMEKAGLAISRRLLKVLNKPDWQQLAADGIVVLVGPGHNGGDGLVVARELHLAGLAVQLWRPYPTRRPLTEAHWRHALWLGLPELPDPPDPSQPQLWVDAIFGIGQRRPPGEKVEQLLIERQRLRPGALVAIDCPTGLCADTGRRLGKGAATAAITFCLGLLKQGLIQDSALAHVGRLERIDLGLPLLPLTGLADCALGLGGRDAQSFAAWGGPSGSHWQGPPDPAASKYERGRLLVVAGSCRFRGAAHLALAGASASGCGSLQASIPVELANDLWTVLPHVVVRQGLGATETEGLDLAALELDGVERLDAVLLGPGIGLPNPKNTFSPASDASAWEQLGAFEGLLVLDADGLNRLAGQDHQQSDGALAWLRRRSGPTWLTPHQGEFARLFPHLAELPALEASLAAAQSCGATVLLKGAHSIIAAPDGRRWQLLEACPAVARAGLGDVLAGYAAGVGARARAHGGLDAQLLAAAALVHALAGCRVSHRPGPAGTEPLAVARNLAHWPAIPSPTNPARRSEGS